MCAFMDEGGKASMMEGVEDLLPIKTAEQVATERRVNSEEAQATRDRRKRDEQTQFANNQESSPVLLAAPSAELIANHLFDRDDMMFHTWTWDWDIYNGNVRILYSSYPDRTQYGLADWKLHVYVAEMTPLGQTTQQLITSKQANDHSGLALRRGHDEVLFHRFVNGPEPGEPASLERWSVADQRMLSSIDISDIEPGIDNESWQPATLRMATSDGNVLYEARRIGTDQDRRLHYGWFKLSPDGRNLGSGTLSEIRDNIGPSSWFHTGNGGGGITVNITPVASNGLTSGLVIAPDEASYETILTAHVAREKRILVIGTNGTLDFISTPIERDIVPLGQPDRPQVTNMADMQSRLRGQQQWQQGLLTRYDANRSTREMSVGPHLVESIKETRTGFAYLTKVTANQNLKPPIHGDYIIEFDKRGEQNEIRLQPLVEQMNITLTTFAPANKGGFYLHGSDNKTGDNHIILIDGKGNPLARGSTKNNGSAKVEGIMADDAGVWLYGHEYRNRERSRIWVERVAIR